MARTTLLDRQWEHLMSLCESEARFRSEGRYTRTLQLVEGEIVQLAESMGFSKRRIVTRDFRAVREGRHIVRIVRD